MQLQIGNLLLISSSWRYTHKEPARPTAKNYVKDELDTRTVFTLSFVQRVLEFKSHYSAFQIQ